MSANSKNPQQEPIPHKLQPHIQDWSNKPLGHCLPRKAWVQLNRLRTGIGKFGDSMVKWGFGNDMSANKRLACKELLLVAHTCALIKNTQNNTQFSQAKQLKNYFSNGAAQYDHMKKVYVFNYETSSTSLHCFQMNAGSAICAVYQNY